MRSDAAVRRRALDPAASFIVQAPAGSGKTELLIQRYLVLLSRVDSPEAVVAITFTKKAAGEMRARVLDALKKADAGHEPQSPHEAETLKLAQAALVRDAAQTWRLLENPARMRVQTIDSLSASITRQMPWLARFGEPPDITEKAQDLYRAAARNTLRTVEQEERSGTLGPLSVLLLHLDNNFGQAARLLAGMLEKRDQWLRHTGVEPDLQRVRAELEQTLRDRVQRELAELRNSIPAEAVRDIILLLELDELPQASEEHLPDWLRLGELVLTQKGDLRKKAPTDFPKERCMRLIQLLSVNDALVARLADMRRLPQSRFTDKQWETMEALVDVLPKAVAHLQLVFRERGRVDFAELSIRACDALGHLHEPSDLALSLGYRIEHLLVDEFQDTSYTQFDLLHKLTAGWEPEDGRTLFLVGDPMQSIYRFRQADVSLFLKARREGIGEVPLEALTLTANFRSDPAIVNWVNETFSAILPKFEDINRGAVAYTASEAARTVAGDDASVEVHPFLGESRSDEAERIAQLVAAALGSVAILVRARSHLIAAIAELRARGIRFQAIEIDQLGDRSIVQDLMALTFALAHLADRISWLAILRAPWCGLTIQDLHELAGSDRDSTVWDLLHRADLQLTSDGSSRWQRALPALTDALAKRGRVRLRALVEQTWLRLGGPACVVDETELSDAAAYFDLLEGLESAGDLAGFETIREQVTELFSQPDSEAGDRVQIMTIHRAKGLEFDTVILPGLGQRTPPDSDDLLVWLEQEGELLLAPMSASGEEFDPLYKYLAHIEKEKKKQEEGRLLYVAATRARDRLHLLGCAKVNPKDGQMKADSGSFLNLLWPAVGHHFRQLGTAPPTVAVGAKATRQVRRLPASWVLPAAPPAVTWARDTLERVAAPGVSFEWVGDTLRHAGTVLHAYLRRVATEGLEGWDSARVASSQAAFRSMLSNLGVPPMELAEASGRVEKALLQTLRDEQGRWLLSSHAEAQCEYAITGLVDGKLVPAVMDRTFVDEQGVRWIVDYKTSSHEGGGLDNFLDEEKRRHAPQLERYARLIAQQDERPIRLMLYFPLLNASREWAAPTIKRRQASFFE